MPNAINHPAPPIAQKRRNKIRDARAERLMLALSRAFGLEAREATIDRQRAKSLFEGEGRKVRPFARGASNGTRFVRASRESNK